MQKKAFVYEIMAFEIVIKNSRKFLREYLSSAVNVLAKRLNISVQTKADFFQLNLPRIHKKVG